MKIPVIIQMQPGENGAAALCMMLGYHKKYVPLSEIREVCVSSRNGSSPEQIIQAAAEYGLEGEIHHFDFDELVKAQFPLMIHWKKRYYAIIKAIRGNYVVISDPAKGEYKITIEKFKKLYKGTAISFKKNSSFKEGGKPESLYCLIKDRIISLRKSMIVLLVLTVIGVCISLAMVNTEKDILDTYIGAKDTSARMFGYIMLGVYLILLGMHTASAFLKTRLVNKASRDISASSGSVLFKKMFAQPMKFFEQYSPGELIGRIDNNLRLDNSIIKSLVPRAIDMLMTIIYIITLIGYNRPMAFICLVIVVVNLLVSLRIQEQYAINSRSMITTNNALNTSVLNGMNMIDTIKSTGAERSFYSLWHNSQEQFMVNKMINFRLNALSSAVSGIHTFALQGVQLFIGAYFIVHGSFTLGSMALFQSILNSMINSMSNCLTTINSLQTMRTNIERVNDITEREIREPIRLSSEEYDDAKKLDGHIETRHLCFRYNPGDAPAIDDVSIEVKPGQMVAIVGATGCGKSTLLKLLSNLYTPESGEILYSGRSRNRIADVIFHSSIATVDQEITTFDDSVYNNLTMWDTTVESYEVILAAKDAQIHDRISKDRLGYSSPISENGRNFSGGELQRLELARALSHEPTILFLDEFTSALDALTEDRVINSIKAKGTTCVIVAHRLSTIVDCDKIYVMDRGRIVQEGTHDELYGEDGLYRKLIKER